MGKLPTGAILGGVLLNQKLNPSTLENESDKQKLMVLLRTFFEVHKGWHIQYNIVSRDTLLEAKKHPDQYRDLVVRVAGYSAFFTALSPDTRTISSPVPNIRCNPSCPLALCLAGQPCSAGRKRHALPAFSECVNFHSK